MSEEIIEVTTLTAQELIEAGGVQTTYDTTDDFLAACLAAENVTVSIED